ncbi:hypothetical protein FRC10_003458 [Ceratobasidium sp. 414]|nr:hypothetical protein FRC10_003458 [Ceratobasidium sp. 414]
MHEVLASWASVIRDEVNVCLKDYAHLNDTICSDPELQMSGTADCTVTDLDGVPHKKQPDQGFSVFDQKSKNLLDEGWPCVVFEASHSQLLKDAIRKAWSYLWGSDFRVQAVVIYELPYPLTELNDFESRIGIWVRDSESLDELYPLDSCLDKEVSQSLTGAVEIKKANPRNLGSKNDSTNEDEENGGDREEGSEDLYVNVDDEAGSNDDPHPEVEFDNGLTRFRPVGKQNIMLRDHWVTVLREQSPADIAGSLHFSVFDFLRICSKQANLEPVHKAIPVSLKRLQEATWAHLRLDRGAKKGSQEGKGDKTRKRRRVRESLSEKRKRPRDEPGTSQLQ